MTTIANHTDAIKNAAMITIIWSESALCETGEIMSPREFRGLLAEMVDEHAADMGADSLCYCKVKFQVDGKQEYRIDINGAAGATDLKMAWAA